MLVDITPYRERAMMMTLRLIDIQEEKREIEDEEKERQRMDRWMDGPARQPTTAAIGARTDKHICQTHMCMYLSMYDCVCARALGQM